MLYLRYYIAHVAPRDLLVLLMVIVDVDAVVVVVIMMKQMVVVLLLGVHESAGLSLASCVRVACIHLVAVQVGVCVCELVGAHKLVGRTRAQLALCIVELLFNG